MNMYKTKVNKENIKLAWGFEVASESCKNPLHYSDYLRMNALPDLEAGLGVTYFFVDCDVEDIPREHCNLECVPMYIKLR